MTLYFFVLFLYFFRHCRMTSLYFFFDALHDIIVLSRHAARFPPFCVHLCLQLLRPHIFCASHHIEAFYSALPFPPLPSPPCFSISETRHRTEWVESLTLLSVCPSVSPHLCCLKSTAAPGRWRAVCCVTAG